MIVLLLAQVSLLDPPVHKVAVRTPTGAQVFSHRPGLFLSGNAGLGWVAIRRLSSKAVRLPVEVARRAWVRAASVVYFLRCGSDFHLRRKSRRNVDGAAFLNPSGRVAQLAEHSALNRQVEGSIPSASTSLRPVGLRLGGPASVLSSARRARFGPSLNTAGHLKGEGCCAVASA